MTTDIATDVGNAMRLLLKDARKFFEEGSERTEAIAGSLSTHDVFLTRDVLLHLAFHGLGTLFDAETKAGNKVAGAKALKGAERFSGNGSGVGGAVLPPISGIGDILSSGIKSVILEYAKTKTIFGKLLRDIDTNFLRDAVGRSASQVTGWTLSGDALQECVPIYEQYLTGGQTFTDLPTEAQEKVMRILSSEGRSLAEL